MAVRGYDLQLHCRGKQHGRFILTFPTFSTLQRPVTALSRLPFLVLMLLLVVELLVLVLLLVVFLVLVLV